MKSNLRIIYMGTPEFAVPSLDILIKNNYNVVGVITAPDKPAGRGLEMQMSDVKKYALEKGLNILQPEKLKDPTLIEQLKNLNADLQVVVAFRMLPEIVWSMPRLGTFNLHASLLPQYRGAAPINWAVINGEKETGVTTFFLQHEIDTGKIIYQEKISIEENDCVGDVYEKLMSKGSELVLKTVQAIENNSAPQTAQENILKNSSELKHAPKIFKEDCKIDWTKSAEKIHNLIRGLSPYPAAWTELVDNNKNQIVKIYKTEKEIATHQNTIGLIETDNKTYIKVSVKNGSLYIKELQLSGKKKMMVEEFLRGYRFSDHPKFS